MATWEQVRKEAPELAEAVQERFDAFLHKTIATLRKDGSPRISGIEATFSSGELRLGMMPNSLKALDLRRDARMALHSGSSDPGSDPTNWSGDAKLAGRAVELSDSPTGQELDGDQPPHHFTVDITEVVLTRVGDPPDHLVIEAWHEGKGLRRFKRV